ncbi:hypothetical protein MKW98_010657 [Papaver atlanticum]|uniref:Reverse transcriptase zinc-binding domain-containing protein n=1 Tax=Papaver atlanticum TaxID=357466 RepID=A0AAD4SHZ2_9MAGN|nr:hypothetical protein MKW98_010657 [Papaver atlanticum]
MVKDVLPVAAKFQRMAGRNNPKCVMCDHCVETIEHMLIQCSFARAVWKGVSQHIWQQATNFLTIKDWILSWTKTTSSFSSIRFCTFFFIIIIIIAGQLFDFSSSFLFFYISNRESSHVPDLAVSDTIAPIAEELSNGVEVHDHLNDDEDVVVQEEVVKEPPQVHSTSGGASICYRICYARSLFWNGSKCTEISRLNDIVFTGSPCDHCKPQHIFLRGRAFLKTFFVGVLSVLIAKRSQQSGAQKLHKGLSLRLTFFDETNIRYLSRGKPVGFGRVIPKPVDVGEGAYLEVYKELKSW